MVVMFSLIGVIVCVGGVNDSGSVSGESGWCS